MPKFLENLDVAGIYIVLSNKCADQSVRMRRRICAYVVCIWFKTVTEVNVFPRKKKKKKTGARLHIFPFITSLPGSKVKGVTMPKSMSNADADANTDADGIRTKSNMSLSPSVGGT